MGWKVPVASIAMIGNATLNLLVGHLERMDPPLPKDVFPLNILVSLVQLGANVCGLVAMIVFLMWVHHVAKRARARWRDSAAPLAHSPSWAVASWFVPLVNLLVPYRALTEVWRASDPDVADASWKTARVPLVFPLWWGTYVASNVLAATGTFAHSAPSRLAAQLVLLVSLGAIIYIMRELDHRQEVLLHAR